MVGIILAAKWVAQFLVPLVIPLQFPSLPMTLTDSMLIFSLLDYSPTGFSSIRYVDTRGRC